MHIQERIEFRLTKPVMTVGLSEDQLYYIGAIDGNNIQSVYRVDGQCIALPALAVPPFRPGEEVVVFV
jgi:hypothetical protein